MKIRDKISKRMYEKYMCSHRFKEKHIDYGGVFKWQQKEQENQLH